MTDDNTYQEWAVEVAQAAAINKDKTLRELVEEKRISTWIPFFLKKISFKKKDNSDPFDILAEIGGLK